MSARRQTIRLDSTPERIEQALAMGPLTAKELAQRLELTTGTIRHCLPLTKAVAIGAQRIGVGRPWIRYALHDWKPSHDEPKTIGVDHVKSIEQAIAATPMTVLELSRHLSLSQSTIRSALPKTNAMVIGRRKVARQHGRKSAVYGLRTSPMSRQGHQCFTDSIDQRRVNV
jgi:predicted transcriptional regulator